MNEVDPIRRYMTPSPHTIGAEQSIALAASVMGELRVRHLPVLRGGRIVGILSDRDLRMVEGLRDVDLKSLAVDEAMTPDPYVVDADTSVAVVAAMMAEHKYGSTIVSHRNKVVGVFTTVDACRTLADVLEARLH